MKHVLIAENEYPIQIVLEYIIPSDYRLTFASSGREAIDRFQTTTVDVVLTDYAMPGLNGLQVAQMIRDSDSSVPIIMMSGQLSRHLKQVGEKIGINAFLDKPFSDLNKVADVIEETLGICVS